MKRLNKGPELKMPELKVPDFLFDLYYDLRDRRLLPLVALALVAIVAVPFLLGGDSAEEPAPSGATEAPSAEAVESAKLTVVEAKPGLRDYRKRLERHRATDPFEQRYSAAVLKDTQLGSDGEASSGDSTSTSVTRTSTSVTKTTKTKAGDTTTTTTTTDTADGGSAGELTLYSFAADVKIVRISDKPDGGKEKQTSTQNRVLPPAAFPNEQAQVVTYLGISPKTQKPLLLISDDVTGVYGEGECLSGASSCQLIEVEAGFPVTFVGPGDVRYKITVLDVEPVIAGEATSGQE